MCLALGVLGCFPDGNLNVKVLKGADHWVLQDEKPVPGGDVKLRDHVTNIIAEWLETVYSGTWKPAPISYKL